MILYIIVLAVLLSFSREVELEQCYYDKDDSQLTFSQNVPQIQIFSFDVENTDFDSSGFGIWSKFMPNYLYSEMNYPQRPFDDPKCLSETCVFKGFYFMKVFDLLENEIAGMVLQMSDNPVFLTHNIYLYNIEMNTIQEGSFHFNPSNYHNNWIYTSFIYQYQDQQITIFTNYNNQIENFSYKIITNGFQVVFGGYVDDLQQNIMKNSDQLLFYKGQFSEFQNFGIFSYYENIFLDMFTHCPLKDQVSLPFDDEQYSSSNNEESAVTSLIVTQHGKRYSFQGWVKQNYDESRRNQQEISNEVADYLICTIFSASQSYINQDINTGDEALIFFDTVDYSQNNKTTLVFKTYFIKIPLLLPVYRDLEEYYKFTYEQDDLYQKTQEWHYFVFDYGRNTEKGESAQLRLYFMNQEPIIQNFGTHGFNKQFEGPYIIMLLFASRFQMYQTSVQIEKLRVKLGQTNNNDDIYICHSSCLDCNGPFYTNCTKCNNQLNYYLTVFNTCQCKYLFEYDQTLQYCIPIEQTQNMNIIQQSMEGGCMLGYFYFEFQNEQLCIQCPKNEVNSIICAECLEEQQTWFLKPMCSYDYYQNQENLVYFKRLRINQDIDVYFVNYNNELQLVEGASLFCDKGQLECYKSNNYHLGQQITIKCKINRYYTNYQCEYCDQLCINCDQNGNCLECQEQYYYDKIKKKCQKCPSECITCKTDFSSNYGYQCLSCKSQYAVMYGRCISCGLNCLHCQKDYNKLTDQYFLRCLSCIDNSIMVIQINGVDCKLLDIENCLYPIMYSTENFLDNSFNVFFQPQSNSTLQKFYCALCKEKYQSFDNGCQLIDQVYYGDCIYGMHVHQIIFGVDYGEFDLCFLSTNPNNLAVLDSDDNCKSYAPNCQMCTKVFRASGLGKCLICKAGYYAHRLDGNCYTCPSQLNCQSCYHTAKDYNDEYKVWYAPYILFYSPYSALDLNYDFRQNMQSQSISDYEIICTSCLGGYVLYNNTCIKYCETGCKNCLFQDGQYVCQLCDSTLYTKILSVIQNNCSQCPSYCQFCRELSSNELKLINPMYDMNFGQLQYQLQCLKPFENLQNNIFYDSRFGQHIFCQSNNQGQGCQNIWVIHLNLYCSQEDYLNDLNALIDDKSQKEFQRANIYFDLLLASTPGNNSFSQFDSEDIYQILRQKAVSQIQINIQSEISQLCIVKQLSYIQQFFSKSVLSAIDVQIELSATANNVLTVEIIEELWIINFSKITFRYIKFVFESNIYKKVLNIQSLWPLDLIFLNTMLTTSQKNQPTLFIITIKTIQELQITNMTIFGVDIFADESTSIFQIATNSDQTKQKTILFQNLSIIESKFQYVTLFTFEITNYYSVIFDKFLINSMFYHFTFFQLSQNQQLSEFYFTNSKIIGTTTIYQNQNFLSLENINTTYIQNVTLFEVQITDSIFFFVEKYANIQFLTINKCKAFGQVIFIQNGLQNQLDSSIKLSYEISNFAVTNLLYGIQTQLLVLSTLKSQSSSISITQLSLLDNFLNLAETTILNTKTYLINIEQFFVIIDSVIVKRGYGISEFFLFHAKTLKIKNLQASASQFYLIHQFIECSKFRNIQDYLQFVVQIQDSQNITLQNFTISKMNSINNPLILVQKESISTSEADDYLQILNFNITDTIQMLTKRDTSASLIEVYSNSKVIIQVSKCNFERNQLHMYYQNSLIVSAVVFLINCPAGRIFLSESQLIYNFVTNGTDNIANIISSEINFNNLKFINNSIFEVSIIAKNLDWEFIEENTFEEKDIKEFMNFKNQIGNGFYQAEIVTINNSLFTNSQGKNGIGFYIQAHYTILQNLQFDNLKSFFQYNEENGGCIYFKLTLDDCQITIKNISLTQIYAQDYGGFVYIQSDHDYLDFVMQNVQIKNIFSLKGSIIYTQFQKSSIKNKISIKNIMIENDQFGLLQFTENINDIVKFNDFVTTRILIFVQNSLFELDSFFIQNNFAESIINVINSGDIIVQNVLMENGTIASLNLIEITPRQDQNISVLLKNFTFMNLALAQQSDSSCDYLQFLYKSKTFNMQCNQQSQKDENPIVFYVNETRMSNLSECLFRYLSRSTIYEINSIIVVKQIKLYDKVEISNTIFSNNNLTQSNSGLIYLQVNKQQINDKYNLLLNQIYFGNNLCGNSGCLYISSEQFNLANYEDQPSKRFLSSVIEEFINLVEPDLLIKNFICFENISGFGVCLFTKNINALLQSSTLKNNKAINKGGAIFFEGQSTFLYLYQCIVEKNQADVGGGIYYNNIVGENQLKFKTLVTQNSAQSFGMNYKYAPTHLSVTLNNYKSVFNLEKKFSTSQAVVEEIINVNLQNISSIYLPSGSPISNYKTFNSKNIQLDPLNLTFRIVPLDDSYEKISNLYFSQCTITPYILNIQTKIALQSQNQSIISKNKVIYNTTSEDYNLDDLILYFDSDNLQKFSLQLQIMCDSLMVPIYDKNQLSIVGFHNNYTLLININTFECRIGEIKSLIDLSCHECDPEQDQYSTTIGANKCSYKDEQTMISVESFRINLRAGYWRPYYDNNQIAYCQNLKGNCLGTWLVGDDSCYLGHIGALCESCDLYNIRGNGQYSVAQQYSCASCDELNYNVLQIIMISLWTLITIILSVKGNITKQYIYPQSPQLIKILTNYFQIINSLTTFKLNLPINFFIVINGLGAPIAKIAYSMDCFFVQITSVEVQYSRLIWQLLLPCFYFLILSILYGLLIYNKKIQYRGSIITTAIIYIIVGSLITLISTRNISGISWIQGNVAQRFDTKSHLQWVYTLCIPFLILFGIIIPIFLFFCLYRIKHQLVYKKGKSLLGYLYHEYKPQAYFWEIIKILNKQFVILFQIYFEDSIYLKGTLIFVLLFCYLQLNLKYKPFKFQKLNSLDYQSTAACGISIILGIGLSVEQEGFKYISTFYFICLILINLNIICKLLYSILNAYLNEFENNIELIKNHISKLLPNDLKKKPLCLQILKSRVESRRKAHQNFQKLMKAFKELKKQSQQFSSNQTLISLPTTNRLNTRNNKSERLSQLALLQDKHY